jgi:hypothetical protein
LPTVCDGAGVTNDMWIDHIQHCGMRRALAMHFHSGRVAGARLRMGAASERPRTIDALRRLLSGRIERAAEIIAGHPLRHQVPRLTLMRMRMLAGAIALGFILGRASGPGGSPWALE